MIDRLRAGFTWALVTLARPFDVRDAFFFGGLFVATLGGVQLSRPWTLVIVGAVLVLKGNGPFITRRGS